MDISNPSKMHRSLSARLSFWIVMAAALLFLGLLLYLSLMWRSGIREEVDKDADQVLENAVLRLDNILEGAERTARVLSWFVIRDLNKPDMMVAHANNTIRYDQQLTSCSISFEPWYFKNKGEYYSICAWRTDDGGIAWEQEGNDQYRYFEKTWYQLPKQQGHTCWTEPYADRNGIDAAGKKSEMLVSYCLPVYDTSRAYACSISLDLSLGMLSEELADVKPYEHAYCILIGEDGTYLVHPDRNRLMYHSIFSDAREKDLPGLTELGDAMKQRETGKRELLLDGEKYDIFFQPIPTTGWSMALFCPESDIYSGYRQLQRNLLLTIVGALLLMFFLFVWLIRRQLAPLGQLAKEADFIASGNFDRPLPPVGHDDEIELLNRSFVHMQTSLVQHIRKLTETTASRERMEKELQIARNIQMGMVPRNFEMGRGIDLYASMVPAREVGGDLYDFFVQGDKLYLCLGDVSGKGVPASLVMAVSRGMFRIVSRQELPPAEIARRINDTASEKNEQMVFVTMFIAVVDLKTGVMDYCNCGHNAPVLIHGEGTEPAFLNCKPNTAIGIIPGFEYEGQRVDLKDTVLFIYTDGLNEAENAAHEQFGNERMLAELGGEPFKDARTTIERLGSAVATHVAGAEASDDLTMLCLKVTPNSPVGRS